jgi:hypothetical protein
MPTQAYRALAVLDELRRAGLPVRDSVIYTEHTDPDGLLGTAGGPVEKVAFIDSRINPDRVSDRSYGSVELGGVVEVYADPEHAAARHEHHPNGPYWVFVHEDVLIRLSPRLTELQASRYAAAFRPALPV